MNGVIILDKPEGFTSFDAVAVMRGLAKERKIGHTGTLDPMATGVLPLLLGRATKAAELLPDTEKEYVAGFRFGEQRDTGDITGNLIKTDDNRVSEEKLKEAMKSFTGDIFQIPPMYSAISIGGKRLYELARQGIEIEREKRPVTIYKLELLEYDGEKRAGKISVACSKGTYIRTLIEDIGMACGTCGVMTDLRRVKACGFTLGEAISLDRLKEMAAGCGLEEVLRPIESLFEPYPAVSVSPAQAVRFQNGGSLDMERLRLPKIAVVQGMRFRVYGPGKSFLGLAEAQPEKGQLKFLKLFMEREARI